MINLAFVLPVVLCLALLFVLIAYLNKRNTILVTTVKAGKKNEKHFLPGPVYKISPIETFYSRDGKKKKRVDPKKYIVAKVDGSCMEERGIHNGDLVFIKAFDNHNKHFTAGDILYIRYHIDGQEGYKLREFKEYTDPSTVKTGCYNHEGEWIESREPHQLEDIAGVVAMRFAA
jgi:hypothetical protein